MFSNKFDEWIFLQFSHLYECRIFSLLIGYILHGLRKELLIGFWRNFISKYLTFCHFITYWFFQKVWPREFKVDMNANIICWKAIFMTLKNYILQSQRFFVRVVHHFSWKDKNWEEFFKYFWRKTLSSFLVKMNKLSCERKMNFRMYGKFLEYLKFNEILMERISDFAKKKKMFALEPLLNILEISIFKF